MGYRYMRIEDLREIFRRWHAGHSQSSIKSALGVDRNTIRNYLHLFSSAGYKPGCELPAEFELIQSLQSMLPLKARTRSSREQFEKHKAEIINLITRKEEPVKPKTAFLIVREKYDLDASYETFKLFIKEQALTIKKPEAALRIELSPGEELQLDYGKVGILYDPEAKRNRTVWSFCAKLSFSRLPFIEFVFSQSQESFIESNCNMAEFYYGLTKFISIDNLKAGVIKPDLYDPRLNQAYAEFAEHYGTFINPCRVATPTDKGKVERSVPQARELFRRLKEVHPTFNLKELNLAAKDWCLNEYGMKNHGTTFLKPKELFEESEKAMLHPLPATRFEVPVWKVVKVSPERFFSFEKKHYAMPVEYRFKQVKVRKSGKMLRIFNENYSLIREYVISAKNWCSLPGDFAEDKEALMKGEYPQWLIQKAHSFGAGTVKLIEAILTPHAYINSWKARSILNALEKYRAHPFREEICCKALQNRIFTPKQIIQMLEAEKQQNYFNFIIPVSGETKAMIRDVKEYFN